MINNLPTIYEVVTGAAKRQSKEKTPNTNSSSKSNKPSSKVVSAMPLFVVTMHASWIPSDHIFCLQQSRAEPRAKAKLSAPKDEEEDSGDDGAEDEEEEHDNTLCGTCGTNDGKDEFWICCDNCEKWYHGKCVKITPARAEHIKQYRCPDCGNGNSNKRIKT
jgi:hypothetical protein